MTYRIEFDGNALTQLRGFPEDAFEALLARALELVDAPWDATVMPPATIQPSAGPYSAPAGVC